MQIDDDVRVPKLDISDIDSVISEKERKWL